MPTRRERSAAGAATEHRRTGGLVANEPPVHPCTGGSGPGQVRWGWAIHSPVWMSLASTSPPASATPHTSGGEVSVAGGTNWPSWREAPCSSMVQATMPSEYQEEKNSPLGATSVLWSV